MKLNTLCWVMVFLVGTTISTATSVAAAKPIVVVLSFGDVQSNRARATLIPHLRKRYRIVHGQKLLDACRDLGITMSRGPNLAQGATLIGAVAVIGGTVKEGQLSLAVYSAKTGQPLEVGSVPFSGKLAGKSLAQALAILRKGLLHAPKQLAKPQHGMGKAQASPRGASAQKGAALSFQPEVVERSEKPDQKKPAQKKRPVLPPASSDSHRKAAGTSMDFKPDGVERPEKAQPEKGIQEDQDENPLAHVTPQTTHEQPVVPPPSVKTVQKPAVEDASPRVEGYLGFGLWFRDFAITDPVGGAAPTYLIKGTPVLKLNVKIRPAAFFIDNFVSNFWLRLNYQQALGLDTKKEQKSASTTSPPPAYGTALREVIFDVGYDWQVLQGSKSPHIDLSLGYGLMDFNVDWDPQVTPDIPDVGYRFLLLRLGSRYPFLPYMGAHMGFDYRVVFSSGAIEDTTQWYGPASTGGINLLLGLNGNYKNFLGSLEYSYSRYFTTFSEAPQARLGKKVAGGAKDIFHTLMLNVGYSY